MKINIGEIKKYLSGARYRDILNSVVARGHWFLLLFILILFGYCGYFWKTYVRDYSWGEERKQEYIKSKENGVAFNRDDFNEMLKKAGERKREYDRNIEDVTDIFRIK